MGSQFGGIRRAGRAVAKQIRMTTPAEFKAQLMNDMKDAMKAKEKVRLASVKAIQAAIKQKEIDEQKEITYAHQQSIIVVSSVFLQFSTEYAFI